MLSKYWKHRGSLSRASPTYIFHLLFDRDRQFKRTLWQSSIQQRSFSFGLSLISAVYPCTSVISHSIHITQANTHRLGSTFVLPLDLLYANVFLLLIQLFNYLILCARTGPLFHTQSTKFTVSTNPARHCQTPAAFKSQELTQEKFCFKQWRPRSCSPKCWRTNGLGQGGRIGKTLFLHMPPSDVYQHRQATKQQVLMRSN